MDYNEFLEKIINEGIEAAKRDYKDELKKDGSVCGFEICRGKNPIQLKKELERATEEQQKAYMNRDERYWWYRCFQAEVEWVCNVVSASLYNQGMPVIITPTARGMMQAAKILGVKERAGLSS